MLKIAMIASGTLPIPNVEGGAVEELATKLLKRNEIEKRYLFDLYTNYSTKINPKIYNKTKIIQIKVRWIEALFNKIRKVLKLKKKNYYIINLCKKIKGKKYDYILVENSVEVYLAIYHLYSEKSKLIFHMHGYQYPKALLKKVLLTADIVLAVSDFVKRYGETVYKKAKIEVFYNCIDFKVFDVKKKEKWNSYSRLKYGLKNDQIVILFVGRLVENKGVNILYEAFMKIRSQYSNAVLVFAGTAGYGKQNVKSELEEYIQKTAEAKKQQVIFTGYIENNDLPQLYAMGDIMVVPSLLEEPFGVVTIEAMAMGLPLIVNNRGGLAEIVDEKCAFILDKNGELVDNLAGCIDKMICNVSLRKTMGKEAYRRVHDIKDFDSKNYLLNFSRVINSYEDNI